MSSADLAGLEVSRETIEKLQLYDAMLQKWNKSINLVASSTLSDSWSRHILDSAQILGRANQKHLSWVDLGAGGGFPGLVVAILAAESRKELRMTLVESDQRKATFLREVSRLTDVPCTVLASRVEAVPALNSGIVSARALAPLVRLLGMVDRHMSDAGQALLMKGAGVEVELRDAKAQWSFDYEVHSSITDSNAVILTVENIRRL